MRITNIILAVLLVCSACGGKDEEAETKLPDIAFERAKWDVKDSSGDYTYRKQMVNDLLKNYQWAGLKKDSVIQMLGQPDATETDVIMYNYDERPFLFGTAVEAIVFEITPDSTIKLARLIDGGWD